MEDELSSSEDDPEEAGSFVGGTSRFFPLDENGAGEGKRPPPSDGLEGVDLP